MCDLVLNIISTVKFSIRTNNIGSGPRVARGKEKSGNCNALQITQICKEHHHAIESQAPSSTWDMTHKIQHTSYDACVMSNSCNAK